jgi:hypothetical protein
LSKNLKELAPSPTLRSYDVLVVIFSRGTRGMLATTPNETPHKKSTTPSGKLGLNHTFLNFEVSKNIGKDRK